MPFDKNQSEFPSEFHREVWWWAVGIVPPGESLNAETMEKCGPGVLEGCYQWHAYFTALSEDMYNNPEAYAPATARQYRDILEIIAVGGVIDGNRDAIIWNTAEWDAYRKKLDKSKPYVSAGLTIEKCLSALKRTGLEITRDERFTVFFSTRYLKVFHAMRVFERSPRVRETPARHHFAHCEFRQLYKSYNPNYDELMRRASDESLYIAREIHKRCVSLKMQRYFHFGIIKYKYNGVRILDYNLYGNEYPTLRVNIGAFRVNPRIIDLPEILNRITEKKAVIDAAVRR